MRHLPALLALALLANPVAALAQDAAPAAAEAPANPHYAADVASEDAIIAALYASISGGVGEARDWDRFRNLFHPSALLIPTGQPPEGPARARAITPQDYIDRSGPLLLSIGFRESEIARHTDAYGHIAQVFSTYEGHTAESGDTPAVRGINSIQLFDDGTRWWIITVYWHQEDASTPIPHEFLPHSH